jgi:hypothetical protein
LRTAPEPTLPITRKLSNDTRIKGYFYRRQQSESPETQVSVAGHRGETVEPEDQSRFGSFESGEIIEYGLSTFSDELCSYMIHR